jgi:hypothetical protein
MKKILILVAATLFTASISAQEYQKAIGARLGSTLGVTYKQFLSERNAFEILGDLYVANSNLSLGVSGLYLWQWNINDAPGLSWFTGPGATAGLVFGNNTNFNFAVAGMIGLEYKFNIPLALSIDLNPRWYFLNGYGLGWSGALSVRYTFGK